ncbi:MAG: ion channel [Candidatus Binataceae bacterium]
MPQPLYSTALVRPLLIGLGITVMTVAIHGLALRMTVRFVRRQRRLGRAGVRFWKDFAIVTAVMLLTLSAHLTEMAVWASFFELWAGEFQNFATAFYQSAENYTTLGYGDIVMSASWRLLGPLEAADGMLMFGVSTAMIFAVIQSLLQQRLSEPSERPTGLRQLRPPTGRDTLT